MALLGLLVFVLVRGLLPGADPGRGASQRFTLLAAFTAGRDLRAAAVRLARDRAGRGARVPGLAADERRRLPLGAPLTEVRPLYEAHVLHRYVAVVVGCHRAGRPRSPPGGPSARTRGSSASRSTTGRPVSGPGRRRRPPGPDPARRLDADAPPRARRDHLGPRRGARRRRRTTRRGSTVAGRRPASGGAGPGRRRRRDGEAGDRATKGDTVRAYIALTKPRIIELLLVTTIPAMVLATRDDPGHEPAEWFRLAVLDARLRHARGGLGQRDQPVPRPRHRPADDPHPAPAAAGPRGHPGERAWCSGSCSGAISIVLMACFVNLVAAFLTLLAIALLRGRVHAPAQAHDAPEHRHRRRRRRAAAGHRLGRGHGPGRDPGAAPVRDGLLLDAAALLGARRSGSARTTRRPTCRCCRSSAACPRPRARSRLYTILLVAISLIFYAVARMGPIYLVAAVVLGVDLPVAGLRPVATGDVARGLARAGDPPVQVLDQLPDAAVRRGRGGQPARRRGLLSTTGAGRRCGSLRRALARRAPARSGSIAAALGLAARPGADPGHRARPRGLRRADHGVPQAQRSGDTRVRRHGRRPVQNNGTTGDRDGRRALEGRGRASRRRRSRWTRRRTRRERPSRMYTRGQLAVRRHVTARRTSRTSACSATSPWTDGARPVPARRASCSPTAPRRTSRSTCSTCSRRTRSCRIAALVGAPADRGPRLHPASCAGGAGRPSGCADRGPGHARGAGDLGDERVLGRRPGRGRRAARRPPGARARTGRCASRDPRVPARVAAGPVAARRRIARPQVRREHGPDRVVGHVAGLLDELAAHRPPRPLRVGRDPEVGRRDLGPRVVRRARPGRRAAGSRTGPRRRRATTSA